MTDFDTNNSIDPDLQELQQEDAGAPVVPVRQVGPAHVHTLAARHAYSGFVNVSDTTNPPECIASEDLRRRYITIVCTGQPVFVGHEKQDVINGRAAILPINTPLTLPTTAQVWVRSAAVGAAVVSYWVGNWAD